MIKKALKKNFRKHALITGEPRFWEGGGGDYNGGVSGFQGEVYQLEICVVVFGTDMLDSCLEDGLEARK